MTSCIVVCCCVRIQIIQAQQEIIERERELESARRKLETIRKAKYKDRPPTDYESGSDF